MERKQRFIYLSVFFLLLNCALTPEVPFKGIRIEDTVEQRLFVLINEYRASQGLAPLMSSNIIQEKSRAHSTEMAEKKIPFSHTGFEDRIKEIRKEIDVQKFVENISLVSSNEPNPADEILERWKKNREHNHNLLGDFNLTGIGVIQTEQGRFYSTQIFIKKYH